MYLARRLISWQYVKMLTQEKVLHVNPEVLDFSCKKGVSSHVLCSKNYFFHSLDCYSIWLNEVLQSFWVLTPSTNYRIYLICKSTGIFLFFHLHYSSHLLHWTNLMLSISRCLSHSSMQFFCFSLFLYLKFARVYSLRSIQWQRLFHSRCIKLVLYLSLVCQYI